MIMLDCPFALGNNKQIVLKLSLVAAVFYCFMHPQLSTIAALKKNKNLATHILAQFSRLALSLYHKSKAQCEITI